MILIINVCKKRLHYYEFVKPIEEILKKQNIMFLTKHYKEIKVRDIKKADKVIICGTSLRDFDYLNPNNFKRFFWIKNFKKPLLGICSGMQIICLIFGAELKNKKKIGFYKENFTNEFLNIKGERGVYHLHNFCTTLPENFEKLNFSKYPIAIKHLKKPIYGVLFHPEVRNKEIIKNFCTSNFS